MIIIAACRTTTSSEVPIRHDLGDELVDDFRRRVVDLIAEEQQPHQDRRARADKQSAGEELAPADVEDVQGEQREEHGEQRCCQMHGGNHQQHQRHEAVGDFAGFGHGRGCWRLTGTFFRSGVKKRNSGLGKITATIQPPM
jgi:hypothetical protein